MSEDLLPLTPAVFHTLLTLADGPGHGYAIAQAVEARTENRVRMGPGTLYGTLARLVELELIREDTADGQGRRRVYRLTMAGESLLRREAERMAADVEMLRAKALLQ
ncbi:MAG: PadR family transcriptional regulator [Acidobacteria bacterium]|nr:PadR family transcriptional regulator [Acidobacteriota bacterium]